MAEYHLHAQIIKRSEGRSAVACAAYRAGEKLYDERLRTTWNFARKPGVVHREILAPKNVAPRLLDRELLWNEVERIERYKNAQLAKEFDIALPVELSPKAQLALAREFVRDLFVSQGLVCDFAIHREDGENPHFHLMTTLRTADEHGLSRLKLREWESREEQLERYRASWAEYANRALANEKHRARIDHRSYRERGIALRPRPKLYRRRNDAARDGRDHVTARVESHRAADLQNQALILEEPHALLTLLTSTAPTFSEHDLCRALFRYVDDPQTYQRALARVKACDELVPLGVDDRGVAHYSTRQVMRVERAILDDAHVLAQRGHQRAREAFVEQALLLAPHQLNADQQAALRHITMGSDFAIVAGFAGTGKSTLLEAARVAWEAQGLTVVGAALSGIAAENLARDSKIRSRTIAGWQWRWNTQGRTLTNRHVMVIDEAAMVGTQQFADIIAEVRRAGAKLVLVGDTRQLQAIDPGAPMRLLQTHYAPATLSTVIRQRAHAWQRSAVCQFAEGHAADALQAYAANERVHGLDDSEQLSRAVIKAWGAARAAAPQETSLLLAFRRRDARALNELARAVRRERGELGPDQRVRTLHGDRLVAVGDRICFLKNRKLGECDIKNGTLGTLERCEGTKLLVRLDDGRQLAFDARKYNAFDHGYATTIHKSQGSTVDRTFVLASRYMDASASYVALSRHRANAELFYSREEFASVDALITRLSREERKPMAHELLASCSLRQDSLATRRAELLLSSRPADRRAELEALRLISMRRQRSGAEILDQLPQVQALHEALRSATARAENAQRALDEFARAHPAHARLKTADYRALLENAQASRAAAEQASTRLTALRARADVREQAADIADRHNAVISRALTEWRSALKQQEALSRQTKLTQHALRRNAAAKALQVRALSERDAGNTFQRVRVERTDSNETLVYLRDPRGGPLVIAYPEQCAQHGLDQALIRIPSRDQQKGRGL